MNDEKRLFTVRNDLNLASQSPSLTVSFGGLCFALSLPYTVHHSSLIIPKKTEGRLAHQEIRPPVIYLRTRREGEAPPSQDLFLFAIVEFIG